MNWYTLPASVPWLTLSLVIPLAGALLVALTPGEARRVVKQLGVLSAVITLVLVAAIIGGFQHGVGNLHLQFEETLRWIPSAGISYHLGVDGLSLFLLEAREFRLIQTGRVSSYALWTLGGAIGVVIVVAAFLGYLPVRLGG